MGENIAKVVIDDELISNIYKQLIKCNIKKPQFENGQKN